MLSSVSADVPGSDLSQVSLKKCRDTLNAQQLVVSSITLTDLTKSKRPVDKQATFRINRHLLNYTMTDTASDKVIQASHLRYSVKVRLNKDPTLRCGRPERDFNATENSNPSNPNLVSHRICLSTKFDTVVPSLLFSTA